MATRVGRAGDSSICAAAASQQPLGPVGAGTTIAPTGPVLWLLLLSCSPGRRGMGIAAVGACCRCAMTAEARSTVRDCAGLRRVGVEVWQSAQSGRSTGRLESVRAGSRCRARDRSGQRYRSVRTSNQGTVQLTGLLRKSKRDDTEGGDSCRAIHMEGRFQCQRSGTGKLYLYYSCTGTGTGTVP